MINGLVPPKRNLIVMNRKMKQVQKNLLKYKRRDIGHITNKYINKMFGVVVDCKHNIT